MDILLPIFISMALALALLFHLLGTPENRMIFIDSPLAGRTVNARRTSTPRKAQPWTERATGQILAMFESRRGGKSTIYLYIELDDGDIEEVYFDGARIIRTAGEVAR